MKAPVAISGKPRRATLEIKGNENRATSPRKSCVKEYIRPDQATVLHVVEFLNLDKAQASRIHTRGKIKIKPRPIPMVA